MNATNERIDAWWLEPVFTITALVLFSIYSAWAALQGAHYEWGPYLSPFYSPNLAKLAPGLVSILPFSPAFLVIWAPLGFRATCYFYRRAYYRAAFTSPPACAVGNQASPLAGLLGKGKQYTGESRWPFILQNMHRFFFYIAALLTVFHWVHVVEALNFKEGLGIGVGTVVLFLDAVLLTLYVFSCHSWRHLLAGRLDCFTCSSANKMRHEAWTRQSKLNERHMEFAWASMLMVGLADLYVRLLSMGVFEEVMLVQTGWKLFL